MTLKIGVVKPDYGVTGGFEYLLARLASAIEADGHEITPVSIPGKQRPRPIWGQADAPSRWFDHPDYFNYLAMVHDTRRLELDAFDLVMSTQPPGYLAPHDRILGLFYHQARIFYELAEPYVNAGYVDPTIHAAAVANVRAIDDRHRGGVQRWLAGSNECARRLTDAWNIAEPIDVLDAPPLTDPPDEVPPWSGHGPVVCVGRQEWPKRAELVVGAAHIHQHETTVIGDGGRLQALRDLDRRLTAGELDASTDDLGELAAPSGSDRSGIRGRLVASLPRRSTGHARSPVTIAGQVGDAARNQAYADASVVIAPAYREDYGLTALEAMVWGKPVVVCRDGGGLVETVESTGAGIVVEPNAAAIAAGVQSILHDPAFAAELRDRAISVRSTHTWERAGKQLLDAVMRSC